MSVVIHDGKKIPTADPKDIDSDVWYGFTYDLEEGEVITDSKWLINGVLVDVSDTQDTITVNAVSLVSNVARINISGGTLKRRFKLTNRIETTNTPRDDKSCYIKVTHT
jgi:hypothetical protein